MPFFGEYVRWRLQLIILLVSATYVISKECYICSGSFPERDCELWPATVRYGPGKQECANRYCTTQIRYRAMQHLLIPLGPNKGKATAAPLRPADFEVASISRDCVDRLDTSRDNHCFPDAGGLGATCFTSCLGELCNSGLRKPNITELYGKSHPTPPIGPTGPNEFDRWTPPTVRSSTTTRRTTTVTTDSYVEEGKAGKKNDIHKGDADDIEKGMGKDGKKDRRGKGGNRANIRGFPEDEQTSGTSKSQAKLFFIGSLLIILLH